MTPSTQTMPAVLTRTYDIKKKNAKEQGQKQALKRL